MPVIMPKKNRNGICKYLFKASERYVSTLHVQQSNI